MVTHYGECITGLVRRVLSKWLRDQRVAGKEGTTEDNNLRGYVITGGEHCLEKSGVASHSHNAAIEGS